jgi:hypothetical protein
MPRQKAEPKPGQGDQSAPLPSLHGAPPDPEPDVPPELTIAAYYRGFGVQQLAAAAAKTQDSIRGVEEQLATWDDWRREAAKLDEEAYGAEPGGPEDMRPKNNTREAHERREYLVNRRWALERRATALSMAARLAKLRELTAEMNERQPLIVELEQQVDKLTQELSNLRYEQADAQAEAREIQPGKHEGAHYRELAQGPPPVDGGNGGNGAARSLWSERRITMQGTGH